MQDHPENRLCFAARMVSERRHRNPVYPDYFADPFVWKHGGMYYAIGTGESEASGHALEKVFPLLESANFLEWRFAGRAMNRVAGGLGNCYWAPAIAFANRTFYLYYSVGRGDKAHQLRFATSDCPTGPYQDSGKVLLDPAACPFAIDPHPFRDDDGHWYLFYARDFLDFSADIRAGTALVARRMRSMTELEGEEIPVLRAGRDWQRFEAHRFMYGKVWDWHTLEGPCVYKREGRYYCFYSGGRWENNTYGVDYGVSETVKGPYSDAGNEDGPRVLRTVAGQIIGPGHNTVIVGPDGQSTYIVYHGWDAGMKARRMFIDLISWTPDGPRCAPKG